MRLSPILTQSRCGDIHRNALTVLEETGVTVESDEVQAVLSDIGATTSPNGTITFSRALVERLLADSSRTSVSQHRPPVRTHMGIYEGRFLDPISDSLMMFNETILDQYVGFARSYGQVKSISVLGIPFVPEEFSGGAQCLLEKLYAWKYGIQPDGLVDDVGYCQPLVDMFQCHSDLSEVPLSDVFRASGFLVSPLTLARPQCEQLLWFSRKGLEMSIGTMPSIGGSAPITLAGTLTLMVAEQIFLYILRRALFGIPDFSLGVGVCSLDMRTGFPCYGRPEQYRVTLGMASMAQFYECQCHGHAGLADAHRPSAEAGVQKTMGLLTSALALGSISASVGLLSMDEVCSPVQLVIDIDTVEALNALLAPATVDETECALSEIQAVGPGGSHLGSEYTAERCRTDVFTPAAWSCGPPTGGMATEICYAKERWLSYTKGHRSVEFMGAEEYAELAAIIRSADR